MEQNTKKNYDLFIVGNGFDVSCEYKTTYNDYLNSGKSNNSRLFSCFQNSNEFGVFSNSDWNGFEKMLCQYLCFIKYLFISKNVSRMFTNKTYDGYNSYTFTINRDILNDINMFLSFKSIAISLGNIFTLTTFDKRVISDYYDFINELDGSNFFPIRLIFHDHFKNVEAKDEVVEKRIIDKINKELNLLEEGLQSYINNETSKNACIPSFLSELIMHYNFKRLLSFNYSSCAEKILSVKPKYSFYIHGNVNSQIVLGIEENMISNQTINNDSEYCVFFKRYRRILKDTSLNFQNRVISPLNNYSIIGIYGHSLDLSDKSVFYQIFNLKANYDIFCYENIEIYKERLNKLVGLDLFDDLYSKNKINFIDISKP